MRREDGQEAVVGIHFVIDAATCDGEGVDVRVDANVEFIDGHVAAAEVSADRTGAWPVGDVRYVASLSCC